LILSAEKYIYKNATLLSGNNPAMVRYCESVSSRSSISRVNVPPLDLEHFANSTNVDFRELYQIPQEATLFLYMGTFFSFSGLDVVIEEFSTLLENDPNAYLMLIGGGELDKQLKELVTDLNLDSNVIFTGFVDYANLPSALKAGDVAINAFQPELLTNVALPNKILQYMAAGIPVVSTSLDGIHEILGEYSGVTWVTEPKGLMKTALELSKLPSSELRKIINSQQETVKLKFNKTMALEGFRSTVENLK
jgi:glycosyltransferase involved in cell wall biosynthesis